MINMEQLLNSTPPKAENKPNFNREDWIQKKREEKAEVYAKIDEAAKSVAIDGGKLAAYLNLQSHMELYSAANCLLIATQRPDARQLKDYEGWKQAGGNVKQGEKGIAILEPGERYQREDGSTGVNYNVKKVFDITQVNGVESPKVAAQKDARSLLHALVSHSPVPIRAVEDFTPSGHLAFYNPVEREVMVRKGIESEPALFAALAQEMAHATLDGGQSYERDKAAFPAELAAYMLCKRHGVEEACQAFDFNHLPESFSKAETSEVRAVLSSARKALCEVNDRMNRSLAPHAKAKKDFENQR